MALDNAFFDSINIDVVKKKYYNAGKVDAVMQDIREQAAQLIEENLKMKKRLDELDGKAEELGNAVLSIQAISKEIIGRANAQATRIVGEARQERDRLLSGAEKTQDYAVSKVEACFSRLKKIHADSIEAINNEWQDFLCGLTQDPCAVSQETPAFPQDLEDKVNSIAKELFEIANTGK